MKGLNGRGWLETSCGEDGRVKVSLHWILAASVLRTGELLDSYFALNSGVAGHALSYVPASFIPILITNCISQALQRDRTNRIHLYMEGFYFYLFFFFFFLQHHVACGSPPSTRDKSGLGSENMIPNHRTTREFPLEIYYKGIGSLDYGS